MKNNKFNNTYIHYETNISFASHFLFFFFFLGILVGAVLVSSITPVYYWCQSVTLVVTYPPGKKQRRKGSFNRVLFLFLFFLFCFSSFPSFCSCSLTMCSLHLCFSSASASISLLLSSLCFPFFSSFPSLCDSPSASLSLLFYFFFSFFFFFFVRCSDFCEWFSRANVSHRVARRNRRSTVTPSPPHPIP